MNDDNLKIDFNAEQRLATCRPRGVLAAIHTYAAGRLASKEHLAPFRTAIIVPDSHAAAEPTAVLYAILMKHSKIQVRVVRNLRSAADWLGVPENALRSESVHTA